MITFVLFNAVKLNTLSKLFAKKYPQLRNSSLSVIQLCLKVVFILYIYMCVCTYTYEGHCGLCTLFGRSSYIIYNFTAVSLNETQM